METGPAGGSRSSTTGPGALTLPAEFGPVVGRRTKNPVGATCFLKVCSTDWAPRRRCRLIPADVTDPASERNHLPLAEIGGRYPTGPRRTPQGKSSGHLRISARCTER